MTAIIDVVALPTFVQAEAILRAAWAHVTTDSADRLASALRDVVDDATVERVSANLPTWRALVHGDLDATYRADPAAQSLAEVIACYPGPRALAAQRLANILWQAGVPIVPRLLTERAHSDTGIDLHPGAAIGHSCVIDHGTGVVVGETAVIGDRVRLYQGVTLGARSLPLLADGHVAREEGRHPVIGNDVVIYAGATILGRVRVGDAAVIGGNAWVTKDIQPGARVGSRPAAPEATWTDGGGI